METQEMSIMTELIQEVESYLPDMNGFLGVLAKDSSNVNQESQQELHRMTHTIKGAAAMIQLDDLSKSAALMEDVLDEIFAGKRSWDGNLIEAMTDTVLNIGSYCADVHEGETDGSELYRITREAFKGEIAEEVFTVPVSIDDDLGQQDEDLLELLSDDETDDSMSVFFQPVADEEETEAEDDLALLLGVAESDSDDADLETLLGMESDNPSESNPEEVIEEEESGQDEPVEPDYSFMAGGIDPELQELFNEEAEEHLENISRQLNELSSIVTERTAVTDEFRDKLHSLRRSVHTLKGAAAVIGIEPVAKWGHDFEDFLDNLHDESNTISPASLAAMQDGADILEQIALDPSVNVDTEIRNLQNLFPTIMAEGLAGDEKNIEKEETQQSIERSVPEELLPEKSEPEVPKEQSRQESAWQQPAEADSIRKHIFGMSRTTSGESVAKPVTPIQISSSANSQKKTVKRMLRVGSEKIAELMGLSGDLAVNLTTFEKSATSMQTGLDEFEITLQRLRNIVSTLETGFKQELIPDFGATVSAQDEHGATDEFDSLEIDRYSDLQVILNSLNETVTDLESIREQDLSTAQDSWQQAVSKQRRIVGETQGAVVSIQMTPFSTLSNRLYKTVRESAKATGKKVRLLIDGSTLEMDSHIWNVLVDALMHLLRNCVDHGVEMSTQRQLAGKPEQGTIRISCFRQGSRFVLRLSDDGAGLDYDAIRNKARDLYSDSDVALMDDAALAALIFKPGFSVRSEVTSMSGRGVGMDVVRNALDQLNGAIEVSASQGEGTEFVLSMPIAVAQLPALMVMFGEQQFAVPMRDVTSVLRLSAEELTKNTFEVDDESFPLLRPAEILRLKPPVASSERRNGASHSSLAFAVETFGRRGIMVADAIIGQKTVVFKNLGSHLQSTPCVAGVTIMGDGSLVPILQTEDLFNRVESVDSQTDRSASSAGDAGKVLDILIADDSISVRKVLGNFITSQGWHPIVAHDGADAMVKIKEKTPDLIILDIEMPNMNGFEVLQALQSQTEYRDIPVLMLTSRSADKYKEKAAGLGASGFVTKPFKNAELISLISGLTSQTPQKDSEQ